MRVTSQMLIDRTIYNLSNNLSRFMRVQEMVSSGRRINTPSDDPIGTQNDLGLRASLAEIGQYKSNISQSNNWLATYENGLGDLKNIYSSAKEIAVMMANDTYDDVARQSAATEIESIFQQVLQIANVNIDGRYLYSGHKTTTKPLESSGNGIIYRGDRGAIDVEIDRGSRVTSNVIGEDIFFKTLRVLGADADLKVGLTGVTRLADLNLGAGIDQTPGTFEIFDVNRNLTYAIDLSGAVTVADVVSAINTQLGAGGNLSVRMGDAGASLEWRPVAGAAGTVTDATPLSNLNGGRGVDREPGKLRIRTGDGSLSFEVNISSATTIGDVRTIINAALTAQGVAGVTVAFNTNGTGLAVTDSNAMPLGLVIEDVSDVETTARDLGISGAVNAILEGRDLAPQAEFVVSDLTGQTTAHDLGLNGTIRNDMIGGEIRARLTLDSTLASLNNQLGFGLGRIKISHGDQVADIDLGNSTTMTVADLIAAVNRSGLDIRAEINSRQTGIQITSLVSDRTLIIENNDTTRTAHNLGVIGSSDMLGSLMLLTTALRNNDRELAERINGDLDKSMQVLLGARAAVGSKVIRMETTRNRLEASEVNVTRLLTEIEGADMTATVSQLAKEENLYQAALLASSKVIQPSLLDFMR